jgi:uroporphyrinogen-III decarboxylase
MSVMVTLRLKADASKLEAWAAANPDAMTAIMDKAKQQGVIAHRFYGDGAGGVMVLDEWPDADSFQTFFHGSMDEIGPMMAAVDAQGEPQVSFWHELETHDQYGWGA